MAREKRCYVKLVMYRAGREHFRIDKRARRKKPEKQGKQHDLRTVEKSVESVDNYL